MHSVYMLEENCQLNIVERLVPQAHTLATLSHNQSYVGSKLTKYTLGSMASSNERCQNMHRIYSTKRQ